MFIYERTLKGFTRESEFTKVSKSAKHIFDKRLKPQIKYIKKKDIDNIVPNSRYTLYFTKQTAQILDFCRHLRNSFCHAMSVKNMDKLEIYDSFRGGRTSTGYLPYKGIIDFMAQLIRDYEG